MSVIESPLGLNRTKPQTLVPPTPVRYCGETFRRAATDRESGKKQHAVERYLAGKRVHPDTRARVLKAVEKLERRQKHSNE